MSTLVFVSGWWIYVLGLLSGFLPRIGTVEVSGFAVSAATHYLLWDGFGIMVIGFVLALVKK